MFSIMVISQLLTLRSCEVDGGYGSRVLTGGGGMLPFLLFPGGPSLSSAHPPTHPPSSWSRLSCPPGPSEPLRGSYRAAAAEAISGYSPASSQAGAAA